MSLKGKDLLTIHDLSVGEVAIILDTSKKIKQLKQEGKDHSFLKGKTLAMIFHKASTRTRVSFEAGFAQLGGHALFLDNDSSQMGRGEPIKDTARVLDRYVDGIMIRTFSQESIEELAKYSKVPVINGLTDFAHPCQALTDAFTIMEYKGPKTKGLKVAYLGDGNNNMANSLMFMCAKTGMDFCIASPEGYKPDPKVVKTAQEDAKLTGAKIEIVTDPMAAVQGADAVYTDVWASMGMEAEQEKRKKDLAAYQLDLKLLGAAKKNASVLHCLPAHRGEEITEEVLEGQQSVVFDQAENRLHVQKAIMLLLMSDVSL